MKRFVLFVLVVALSFCSLAFGQATVSENLETATLWVDTVNGSDSNPGTRQLPLQTIGAAITAAQNNNYQSIGTKVIINPGVYRESLNLSKTYKSTSLPMTFQAATAGTVTLSGAVPYTSWSVSNGNPAIYTSSWPNQWGFCPSDAGNAPHEPSIVLRREMVFVNGAPMTEVLSLSQMVFPGTFFVDEGSALLYVWPPEGTIMSSADVEVANSPTLLTIFSMQNVVFRGINFSYANTCHAAGAVYVEGTSSNIIFDTDGFNWNSGQGLSINNPAANITVTNSTANHNGAAGFQSYESLNTLYNNITANYNNWRGAQGVYYDWNTGGAHFFSDHNQTIDTFTAAYNQTFGLHWDTDVQNAIVSNFSTFQNMSGFLTEKSEGPISVTGSNFCGALSTAPGEGGFILRNSENVSITNSVLYDNAIAQLLVTGVAGGIPISNWQTKTNYNLITQKITLTGNIFEAVGTQDIFKDGYLNGADWADFKNTLTANNNTYWNSANGNPWSVPVPKAPTLLNFPGWQTATGQDAGSSFNTPITNSAATCNVSADAPDWQFLSNNQELTTDATGSAVFTLSAASLGGMTGTVNLAVDGLSEIPGATVTFSPSTLTIPGTAALVFNAGVNTPVGTYTITALANSGNVTRTATLNVTVPTTSVRLSTLNLTFPSQPVLTSSAAQQVIFSNVGSGALAISGITIGAGFTQTNNCGTSLGSGKSCTINVVFAPHTYESYSSKLTITESAGTETILLTGTTVGSSVASISVKALYFGTVIYGNSTATQKVTLTNKGTAAMNISNIAVTGADTADFNLTTSCQATLAVSGTCTVTVFFSPTALGARAGTITFTDDAVSAPVSVTMTGTGKTAVSYSPTTIGFGAVKVGKTPGTRVITVKNLSSAALTMGGVKLTGPNAGEFNQTTTCGATLAGPSSCTITVGFSPVSTGSKSATITISDSDPTATQTVTLTGTGQ